MNIKIFDLGMNGEGVGELDGKKIFVPKALPGEVVDIEIVKDCGNYAHARLLKLVQTHVDRCEPACTYSDCGGCDLMHMTYDCQLRFKRDLVRKTIKKISGLDVDVKDCVPSDKQFGFRNKVSFSFTTNAGGMLAASSHNVVNIDKCMLATDIQNEIFHLFKCNINPSDMKYIKNLVVKDFALGVLICVVVKQEVDLQEFYNVLKDKFVNIGLSQMVNNRRDSVVLSGKMIHVGGLKMLEMDEFGLTYPIDMLAFHQTNENIQNKIYSKMFEYINDGDTVVNGYSGAGVLSGIIAKKAKQVIGIEIVSSSHKSAELLKKCNRIDNLTNICGDFTLEYKRVAKAIGEHTLVLDPSKKGCGQIISDIKTPNKIIYLSCNPIAMAKDLRLMEEYYTIKEVIPFDMFPNTKSVETLVLLERRG